MKRSTVPLLATLLALSTLASPALADEEAEGPFDHPHTHALLIGADVTWFEEVPEGAPPYEVNDYRRCVDLAGGKTLRTQAHHEKIHFGRAGRALAGAGHLVIPIGVFGFVGGCADMDVTFGK
jgi:hypothetical protein